MAEWLNDWINEWINEWMNEWLNDWMTEWMTEWIWNEWMNVYEMNEWMNNFHIQYLWVSTTWIERRSSWLRRWGIERVWRAVCLRRPSDSKRLRGWRKTRPDPEYCCQQPFLPEGLYLKPRKTKAERNGETKSFVFYETCISLNCMWVNTVKGGFLNSNTFRGCF